MPWNGIWYPLDSKWMGKREFIIFKLKNSWVKVALNSKNDEKTKDLYKILRDYM